MEECIQTGGGGGAIREADACPRSLEQIICRQISLPTLVFRAALIGFLKCPPAPLTDGETITMKPHCDRDTSCLQSQCTPPPKPQVVLYHRSLHCGLVRVGIINVVSVSFAPLTACLLLCKFHSPVLWQLLSASLCVTSDREHRPGRRESDRTHLNLFLFKCRDCTACQSTNESSKT